jgi:CRISPR-associated protein Cmr4
MFDNAEMLYLYVETPLHAGSGSSVGIVDLPIQRERVTNYPLVQASGLKGKLRSEAYEWPRFTSRRDALEPEELADLKNDKDWKEKTDNDQKREAKKRAGKKAAKELGLEVVFGPESDEADEHAGALSPGDARLLLFPVRSLVGVFAYTTSRTVLSRFKRDLEAAKKGTTATWTLDNLPDAGAAWTVDDKSVVTNQTVVLEEFSFKAGQHPDVKTLGDWLADNAFPQTDDYKYFRDKVRSSLVILPEDSFRDFTQFATEVVARIRIDQETKTVALGALWTEEHLPSDTLLYSPLHASRPRTDKTPDSLKTADDVLAFVHALKLDRIQLGGDETIGRGIVKLRLSGGEQ